MKFSAPLLAFLAASSTVVSAFTTTPTMTGSYLETLAATSSSLEMSSASTAVAFEQPPRVVRDQLPTVYVYDHCPFCVRVRVAMGIKNIKHNLYFLANDDIPTPTALVGKKIAPIFVSNLQFAYLWRVGSINYQTF